jgi:hypothetical protein
VFDVVQ